METKDSIGEKKLAVVTRYVKMTLSYSLTIDINI